ncbi:MAG: hypothetical protein FWH18_02775 [Marinilabiliaceae bacterium]|nr:hypothetical protein [Marinilabiliaceae bacterium]
MKKVSMFICVALLATSVLFVSCKNDDEDDPIEKATVSLVAPTLEPGASEGLVTGTIVSKAELKSVQISINDGELENLPYTKDEENEDTYLLSFTVTGIEENCTVKVVVDNGAEENAEATITIIFVPKTPLVAGTDFTLTYTGSSQTDGRNVNGTVGIKWSLNTNGGLARFIGEPTTVLFVSLANGEIATKEDLADAYETGTKVEQFEWNPTGFTPKFFISKVGDNYFLINVKTLAFSPGNNTATVSYKH